MRDRDITMSAVLAGLRSASSLEEARSSGGGSVSHRAIEDAIVQSLSRLTGIRVSDLDSIVMQGSLGRNMAALIKGLYTELNDVLRFREAGEKAKEFSEAFSAQQAYMMSAMSGKGSRGSRVLVARVRFTDALKRKNTLLAFVGPRGFLHYSMHAGHGDSGVPLATDDLQRRVYGALPVSAKGAIRGGKVDARSVVRGLEKAFSLMRPEGAAYKIDTPNGSSVQVPKAKSGEAVPIGLIRATGVRGDRFTVRVLSGPSGYKIDVYTTWGSSGIPISDRDAFSPGLGTGQYEKALKVLSSGGRPESVLKKIQDLIPYGSTPSYGEYGVRRVDAPS